MNSEDALLEIQDLLDGDEWTAATLDDVADVMRRAGYCIRGIDEFDGDGFGHED